MEVKKMPELPEVETVKKALERKILNKNWFEINEEQFLLYKVRKRHRYFLRINQKN